MNSTTSTAQLTYKQLQAALRELRNAGHDVPALNSRKAVLVAALENIQAEQIEVPDHEKEVVAQNVDAQIEQLESALELPEIMANAVAWGSCPLHWPAMIFIHSTAIEAQLAQDRRTARYWATMDLIRGVILTLIALPGFIALLFRAAKAWIWVAMLLTYRAGFEVGTRYYAVVAAYRAIRSYIVQLPLWVGYQLQIQ